ncbi:MAG: serine/threonine protein kinase, partial [Acidobacteriia bacterium]|nr:serine/threonine protein kinase [Terriglobia bacterium]
MIGTTISNYRIDEKIGEGGMGVVYKAMDLNLDRVVAIKVISADLSRDPGLLERFRAEAKAQAHLNHTNIASLYTLLTVDNNTCIVMEYLEGETLDQILRRRGLIPAQEAVPYFRQALLGIGFAHRMGIIHRDIKPSNIMVNKYGVVKVMDFGIAKVLGGQRLTRTGTQVGTAAYMSPEQIRNKPVDIRSDIYSLGVTLYELLTAHLPFESESEFEIMSAHVNTTPPTPSRHYPYVPRGVEQCVMKALEKDPDARFQTVEDFGAALEHPDGIEQWLAAHPQHAAPAPIHTGGTPPPASVAPLGASTPPPGTPPPPSHASQTVVQPAGFTPAPASAAAPNRSKLVIAAAAGLVVLAALGFGGYQLFKPKPPVPVARSENGPSGSLVPTDTASHAQPHTGAGANPLSSSTSSPASVSPASNPASDITLPNEKKAPSEALQNAQTALSGGRLFRPRNSSAYYWAKQAEQAGDPQGARLEETIYSTAKRQVQRYTDAKNFTAATALVTQMREAYPDRNDLAQLSASVQSAQAVQAGPPQQAQNRPQEQPPVQPVAQQVPTPAQNTQPAPQPVQPPVQQQPPQEAQQAAPSQGYPGVQRPQAGG